MKTVKLLPVLILCIASVYSYSQTTTAGPRVGLNISNFTNADNAQSKAGVKAGGFIIYSVQEHFGISLDALYSVEGAKYTAQFADGIETMSANYDIALNYIRVPIQAVYFFNKLGDNFRPKVKLGPSFGFLASAKQTYTVTTTVNGTVTSTAYSNSDTNPYNSFDVGALAGLGVNYKLAESLWLNFDADYYLGLTDVLKNPVMNTSSVKNNAVSLELGLGFGLK